MLWPAGQQAQDVAQVRPGLDVAEPTTREQRGEDGVDVAAVVAADEEPVFAADGFATELQLAQVVVDGQAPVVEETREADALVACVSDAGGNGRVIEHALSLRVAPREERVDDGS